MNDIIRTTHNDLLHYGTIISLTEQTAPDKSIITSRLITYDNKLLLDIMCNGKVISIIDLHPTPQE